MLNPSESMLIRLLLLLATILIRTSLGWAPLLNNNRPYLAASTAAPGRSAWTSRPESDSFRPKAFDSSALNASLSSNEGDIGDNSRRLDLGTRRSVWARTASRAASLGVGAAALLVLTRPAWASSRSRSDGTYSGCTIREATILDLESTTHTLQFGLLRLRCSKDGLGLEGQSEPHAVPYPARGRDGKALLQCAR